MLNKSWKVKILRKVLGNDYFLKGDEFVSYCPFCKHHKKKLSVNLIEDKWHCWVCGKKGQSLTPLIRLLGEVSELKEYIEASQKISFLQKQEQKKEFDKPVLPSEFKSLSETSRSFYYKTAIKYIEERGFTFDDILFYKLGYCDDGDYKNRVIIPSFDEYGDLNFYVGRAIYKNFMKYKHESLDKDIIFNDYIIDWTKPIVLTEGPFDAMKAGKNAIPLQGSNISTASKLFTKIVMKGVDVYFALDADVFNKQLSIIENFCFYGINSYYVSLNGKKDVGEMTKQEFTKAKENAFQINSSLDLLRLKVLS
jgi:DNA primase